MLQFSLRNLLIAVAAVAVGTAALLNANAWWAALLWGVVLALPGLAGLMVLYRREAQRAFWSGYLLAGGLYILLLAISANELYTPLNHNNLITTKVVVWGYFLLPESRTSNYLPSSMSSSVGMIQGMGGGMSMGSSGMPVGSMGPPGGFAPMIPNPNYLDYDRFLGIGQALWSLLISWIGAIVSYRVYSTRDKARAAQT